MPLKPKTVLSRDDFRAALDSHQISISQVAKATGIPRSYVSEFLSIGRALKPEQLQKVRDFLEGEGVEFEDAPPADPRASDELPPSLAVANICHFPIRPDRVAEAKVILAEIERNDVRIAELLDAKANRKSAYAWVVDEGDGDLTEETESDLRELFALFGANYMLFRYLTLEKSPLDRSKDDRSLRSVMVEILKESFDKAGVRTAPTELEPPTPEPEAEEDLV